MSSSTARKACLNRTVLEIIQYVCVTELIVEWTFGMFGLANYHCWAFLASIARWLPEAASRHKYRVESLPRSYRLLQAHVSRE